MQKGTSEDVKRLRETCENGGLAPQVLRCEMARKNMYIRDDAATAAKRGRVGGEYNPYATVPAASPVPAYYAPVPVRTLASHILQTPAVSAAQLLPSYASALAGGPRIQRLSSVHDGRPAFLNAKVCAGCLVLTAQPAAGACAAAELCPRHKHKG